MQSREIRIELSLQSLSLELYEASDVAGRIEQYRSALRARLLREFPQADVRVRVGSRESVEAVGLSDYSYMREVIAQVYEEYLI